MPPTACISVRRLVKRLPSGGRLLTILDHVDLEIARGESIVILGPSGSGESTLLALMAGHGRVERVEQGGEVDVEAEDVRPLVAS